MTEVDVDRQRIGLSLRLNDEPGTERKGGRGRPRGDQRDDQRGGRGRGGRNQRGNDQGGGRRGGGQRQERPATGSMADALKNVGFGR